MEDKPGTVHNNDIMNIVKLCRSYGVNNIYISSIAYRPKLHRFVRETNDLLRENQILHDYKLINI